VSPWGVGLSADAHRERRPVAIAEGLTVLNLTSDSAVTRRVTSDPCPWPSSVPRGDRPRDSPTAPIPESPAWWADALFTG
jgi:hypothetical protein